MAHAETLWPVWPSDKLFMTNKVITEFVENPYKPNDYILHPHSMPDIGIMP
jgi:hypothetical protein